MTLIDQIGGPEGDLLGIRRILTGGAPGEGSHEERRQLIARFQDPHRIRAGLEYWRTVGFPALVASNHPRLFEALGRRPVDTLPRPIPIVPNIEGFIRESAEFGVVGAGLRRMWRVGPVAITGLAMRSVGRLSALMRGDFPMRLRSFIELELNEFSRFDPPVVFLQSAMTDIAVAMRDPCIIEAFIAAVTSRTYAIAGLATHNFAPLASALKTWGLECGAVLAPWNASGASMRPDINSCTAAARACDFPLWADRLGRIDPPTQDDREAMRQANLIGSARDDISIWCTRS